MDSTLWQQKMDVVLATASFLHSMNTIDVTHSGLNYTVFVALSDTQKTKGLANMEREHLEADGMLFFFSSPSYVPFSAKDMKFDLNVYWFDENCNEVHRNFVAAGDTSPLCCPVPFSYVLELPNDRTLLNTNSRLKISGT